MMNVLGLEEEEAVKILESKGFTIIRREYTSKRGIENADSSRVIRQRLTDDKNIEIIVSNFKTKIQ